MEMKEKVEFAKMLSVFGEIYGKKISTAMVDTYFEDLKEHSLEAVVGAAAGIRKKAKYFPTIADFIEALGDKDEDQALIAWNTFCHALRKVGDSAMKFEDPYIGQAVVQMGGAVMLGDLPPKEFSFRQRDFQALYHAARRRGNLESPVLVGRYPGEKPVGIPAESGSWILAGREDKKLLKA